MPAPRTRTVAPLPIIFLALLYVQSSHATLFHHGDTQSNKPVESLYDPDPLFQLRIFISNRLSFSESQNPLRPLVRQGTSSCQVGYGECTNPGGRCCPTAGTCCQGTGCCASGSFCYSVGCCPAGSFGCNQDSCCPPGGQCCTGPSAGCCGSGFDCVVLNGQSGCCPSGQTCTGAPMGCSQSGYFQCPDSNLCCPIGQVCTNGPNNILLCNPPGSTSPGGTATTETPSVTFITSPSLTSTPSRTLAPSPSSISLNPNYTLRPAPPTSSGSNTTVPATDSRISYTNCGWNTIPGCGNPPVDTMACTQLGGLVTFQFIGSAVFLTVARNPLGMLYSVTVDGVGDEVNGVSGANDCAVQWNRFGMSETLHTLQIQLLGSPPGTGGSSSGVFQLADFIVTSSSGSGTGTGGGGGGEGVSPAGTGVTLPGSSSSALQAFSVIGPALIGLSVAAGILL